MIRYHQCKNKSTALKVLAGGRGKLSIKEEEAAGATFSLNAKAQSPIVGNRKRDFLSPSMGRNGYNFGLLVIEDGFDDQGRRATLTFRGNYDPCVRSGVTDFGAMLGDRVTFTASEETACPARPFWV